MPQLHVQLFTATVSFDIATASFPPAATGEGSPSCCSAKTDLLVDQASQSKCQALSASEQPARLDIWSNRPIVHWQTADRRPHARHDVPASTNSWTAALVSPLYVIVHNGHSLTAGVQLVPRLSATVICYATGRR